MLLKNRRDQALLQHLDSLIEKYGADNPDLLRDLTALKEEQHQAQLQGAKIDRVKLALRIAAWARFAIDRWHDLQ